MLQRSNSVKDKNHRKSMLECIGNTSASWPHNQQRYHLLSQKQECSTAYSTHISNVQVLNDQVLFLCWAWMDQGSFKFALHNKRHYCLMHFCYYNSQKEISSSLNNGWQKMCLKFWDLFPSKKCLLRISFKWKSYYGVSGAGL